MSLMQGPHAGGIVNLPAVFIIAVIAAMLIIGMRKSAVVNALLVLLKLAALAVFVAVSLPHFDAANLQHEIRREALPDVQRDRSACVPKPS